MKSVRAPKQDRSRRTLRRLVDATLELFEEKNFDEIGVAEISQRAGSSVGAFYSRFNDKEALLEHLGGVFVEDMGRAADRLHEEHDWDNASVDTLIRRALEHLVWGHRRHRGTLRALVVRSLGAAPPAVWNGVRQAADPPPFLVERIVKLRRDINHPNPDVAVGLALAMAGSAIRERVLFPDLESAKRTNAPITDAMFVEELTRAFLGFLGVNYGKDQG